MVPRPRRGRIPSSTALIWRHTHCSCSFLGDDPSFRSCCAWRIK
jgi:hypothetical protein